MVLHPTAINSLSSFYLEACPSDAKSRHVQMLVIDIQRLLVDLLGRINLFFNFYINCLTTIAHTVKKLLLIIDIIVHIIVKKQPIFFQKIIDMNAHVEHITKYICVGVRMGAEKIM